MLHGTAVAVITGHRLRAVVDPVALSCVRSCLVVVDGLVFSDHSNVGRWGYAQESVVGDGHSGGVEGDGGGGWWLVVVKLTLRGGLWVVGVGSGSGILVGVEDTAKEVEGYVHCT